MFPGPWTQEWILEYELRKLQNPPHKYRVAWERRRGQQSQWWGIKFIYFVFKLQLLWGLAFNFLHWFLPSFFYQLLDAPVCLTGNWKHHRAKLLPAEPMAVFLREILVSVHWGRKIPRDQFRSFTYLSIHVHFGVYLKARCWTTSRTRVCSWFCSEASPEAEQYFIWLHRIFFCQEFPICKICGWSEETNRVTGHNKEDTRRFCLKIEHD